MTRSVHATEPNDPPGGKTTLFCPACDHESPVDGDWVVHTHANSIEYRCPDCETLLTERERTHGNEDREDRNDRNHAPLLRAWSAWVRAASAWFRRPKRLRA